MARLISYKIKDDNRYSTFISEMSCNSNENLTESNKNKFAKISKKPKKKCNTTKSVSYSKGKKNNKNVPIAMISPTTMTTINLTNDASATTPSSSTTNIISTTKRTTASSSSSSSSKRKLKNCYSLFSCNWISRNNKKRCYRFKRRLKRCCCCCCFLCCKKYCNGDDDDYEDEDDSDDDIDAKFEQYKNEMRLKELAANANSANVKNRILAQQQHQHQQGGSRTNDCGMDGNDDDGEKNKKFNYKRYWSWNDSLRSNSDRFLETLEYDMDGERSLKRINCKNPVIRVTKGWDFFFYEMK